MRTCKKPAVAKKRDTQNINSEVSSPERLSKADLVRIEASMTNHGPRFTRSESGFRLKDDGTSGSKGEDALVLLKTFGSGDSEFSLTLSNQLTNAIGVARPSEAEVGAAHAFVHGMKVTDSMEALLVTQMASVHAVAMECMRRASQSDDSEHVDRKLNQASKLMRTFTMQVDALNKHRGKGQQKVTVEHVHVHEGGQAIVGAVERRDREGEG